MPNWNPNFYRRSIWSVSSGPFSLWRLLEKWYWRPRLRRGIGHSINRMYRISHWLWALDAPCGKLASIFEVCIFRDVDDKPFALNYFSYHLGTVAFGSLIITICRVIRVILEFIDQKLKRYDNEVTKCLLCCCKCFFWCLEKFLRFLNKNAYIMCAIHGKAFCTSARDAFNLLMRNFLRVIALDKVTEFLFFLTKVLITVGMGAATYFYFTNQQFGVQLHYVQVPVVIVMIGTYLIASVFFGVYSMAVDTLFMCFRKSNNIYSVAICRFQLIAIFDIQWKTAKGMMGQPRSRTSCPDNWWKYWAKKIIFHVIRCSCSRGHAAQMKIQNCQMREKMKRYNGIRYVQLPSRECNKILVDSSDSLFIYFIHYSFKSIYVYNVHNYL